MHCVPRKPSKLRCRGGVTTGICGCCPECARVDGEACGGEWNYLGKCDAGLYCEPQQASVHSALLLAPRPPPRDPAPPTVGLPAGRCKKVPDQMMDGDAGGFLGSPPKESKPQQQTVQPCEPRCTPDFCESNPKAICSAIDVVDVKKDCQGQCQHTSCQACYWLEPEPDCGSCARDDYDCVRKFARCVRKRQCSKERFPCRPRKPGESQPQGKFQCEVPRCHGR